MAKRKTLKKLTKSQKSLLIALLIGDGTICSNNAFKLSHSPEQREFLSWKLSLLDEQNLKHCEIKTYVSKCGYNIGKEVLYSRLGTNSTIKALRRSVYKPKKTLTRQLLNWLDARGLAIWYMDDGHINVNTSEQRSSIQHTIKIATCVDLDAVNMIIQYFKEVWNINFRIFKEGSGTYSIASCTEDDCKKFIKIIYPYIIQVPSLLYKIRNNYTKEEFLALQKSGEFRSAEHLYL